MTAKYPWRTRALVPFLELLFPHDVKLASAASPQHAAASRHASDKK